MPRQTFFPNPANRSRGFSPATRAGRTVYVSGQVAVDARGNVVGEGDAARQSAQVFDNMEAALKAAGATLQDVTKITAFLVNQPDYAAYAAERLKRFGDNGPASSTVIVKGLVNPKCLIEVEAIAVVE